MFKLTEWQKHDLKMKLSEKICESNFDYFEVKSVTDGMTFNVSGELFGIIAAISHLIHDLSDNSEIPAEVLATYTYLAVDIISDVKKHKPEEQQEESEDFTMFMDTLNGKLKGDE